MPHSFFKRKMQAHSRFASIAQILTHCARACGKSPRFLPLHIGPIQRKENILGQKKINSEKVRVNLFSPFFSEGKKLWNLDIIPNSLSSVSLLCAHGNFRRCFFSTSNLRTVQRESPCCSFIFFLKKVLFNLRTHMF